MVVILKMNKLEQIPTQTNSSNYGFRDTNIFGRRILVKKSSFYNLNKNLHAITVTPQKNYLYKYFENDLFWLSFKKALSWYLQELP